MRRLSSDAGATALSNVGRRLSSTGRRLSCTGLCIALLGCGGYGRDCDVDREERPMESIHPGLGRGGKHVLEDAEGDRSVEVVALLSEQEEWTSPSELRISIRSLGGDAVWFDGTPGGSGWFPLVQTMEHVICSSGIELPVEISLEHPQTGTRIRGVGILSANAGFQETQPGLVTAYARLPFEDLQTDIDWKADLPPSEGEEGDITSDKFRFDEVSFGIDFVHGVFLHASVDVHYRHRQTYRGRRYPNKKGRANVIALRPPMVDTGDTGAGPG